MTQPGIKTVVFLGAGASFTEGAPLQSGLFKEYFDVTAKRDFLTHYPSTKHSEIRNKLIDFFREIFDIDVLANPLSDIEFPTFEEALGVLDLTELRREGFKNYDHGDLHRRGNELRLIRQYIVIAMATVIDEKLRTGSATVHRNLVSKLHQGRLLNDTTFISTNYDILIDNALVGFTQLESFANVNYGVEFSNYGPEPWLRPSPTASCLYKLHGSLNWLFCPVCNQLSLEAFGKVVLGLVRIPPADCWRCQSTLNPVIVPPTFFKDMSRVFLSMVWNKAEVALREANRIIFCGYSFPDADMHVKYLLKRIQINRSERNLKFAIINNKSLNPNAKAEEDRYRRFFGKNAVSYVDAGFEEFADAPATFYQ